MEPEKLQNSKSGFDVFLRRIMRDNERNRERNKDRSKFDSAVFLKISAEVRKLRRVHYSVGKTAFYCHYCSALHLLGDKLLHRA